MSKKDITIQNKQNTYTNKVHGFFQVINLILLTLLCAVVAFSYKDRLAVIGIYDAMKPLFQMVSLGIPFFDSITEESGSSNFVPALITEIYLIMSLVFLNLYVATRNTFQEQSKGKYFKSFQGLYDFLEEKIYGKFEISVSLVFISEKMYGRRSLGSEIEYKNNQQELIKIFSKRLYILWLAFAFFAVFFSWDIIYVVASGSSFLPLWTVIALAAYCQFRTICEIAIFYKYLKS